MMRLIQVKQNIDEPSILYDVKTYRHTEIERSAEEFFSALEGKIKHMTTVFVKEGPHGQFLYHTILACHTGVVVEIPKGVIPEEMFVNDPKDPK